MRKALVMFAWHPTFLAKTSIHLFSSNPILIRALIRPSQVMTWEIQSLRRLTEKIKSKMTFSWGIPDSPVVKTLCFHCQRPEFNSWSGTKIPQADQCSRKKKKITSSFWVPNRPQRGLSNIISLNPEISC